VGTTTELLDAAGLAARLNVPPTWVREMSRRRTQDRLPCLKLGRYVRFEWGSPALDAWISRRRKGSVQ
jgi:hypothetical protein